jgi:hypothetical protein
MNITDPHAVMEQSRKLIAEAEDATRTVVHASIDVNAAPFVVESCVSGAVSEFHGIDLTGADHTKVRLFVEPNGNVAVVLFPRGASLGITMHGCAALDMHDTGMAVSRIKIVEGVASVRCASGDFTVEGTASFRCGR